MSVQILFYIAAALLAIGLALFLRQSLLFLTDFLRGIFRRLRDSLSPRWRRISLTLEEERQSDVVQSRPYGDMLRSVLRFPLPIVIGLLLALLSSDWLLSPVLFILGTTVALILFSRFRRARWNRLTDESEMLVTQFTSRYPAVNSVVAALEQSAPEIPSGALRDAILDSVRRLRLGKTDDAFLSFETIPHPIPRRLARVLLQSGTVDSSVFLDLLHRLHDDTQSQRNLQQRMRADLTLTNGTITILQLILLGSLISVALLPTWRLFFTSSVGFRMIYVMMAVLGMVGSLYVESEYQMLEERIS